MIVYGDPAFEGDLRELVQRLRVRVHSAHGVDTLREVLIEAGQIEQAVSDAAEREPDLSPFATAVQSVTDVAASALLNKSGDEAGIGLGELRKSVDRLDAPSARVTVKVPEGFAFYALYPEQYAGAAEQWVRAHSSAAVKSVLVTGIRSIGTTLSAVVAATLRVNGWQAPRLTLRLHGHPFERRAAVASADVADVAYAVVVDEGPGLSGSSMAAVARELAAAGLPRDRIKFLPGHDRDPGPAATEQVRQWWDTTPRYVVPLEALRWDGQTVQQVLAARTEQGCGGHVEHIQDVSGGLWREAVYPDARSRPAASIPFEAMKYCVVLDDGRALLWKFSGLALGAEGRSGVEAAYERLDVIADRGWTVRPVDSTLGFVAVPWIRGERLTRADANPDMLVHLARYITEAAGAALPAPEQRAAFERLGEVLYWNSWESLGKAAAAQAREVAAGAAAGIQQAGLPSYGDGRMAPHEWVRTPSGQLLKTDCAGHDRDHTIIGRQTVAWDVAGAIVEWALCGDAERRLVAAVGEQGCGEIPPAVMGFYAAAYAAFRVGQCAMCAASAGPEDQQRLRSAKEEYRSRLARALTERP